MSRGASSCLHQRHPGGITMCDFTSPRSAINGSLGAGRWEMGKLGWENESLPQLSRSPGLFALNPPYHTLTAQRAVPLCTMPVFPPGQ